VPHVEVSARALQDRAPLRQVAHGGLQRLEDVLPRSVFLRGGALGGAVGAAPGDAAGGTPGSSTAGPSSRRFLFESAPLLPDCWVAVAASAASSAAARAVVAASAGPSTSMGIPGPCPVTVDGKSVPLSFTAAALALLQFALVSCSKSCGTGKAGPTQNKKNGHTAWVRLGWSTVCSSHA